MIREFQRDDINKVADIWLDTNIKAHKFIPAEYWKSNFKSVKEALLLAEVYVYEYDTLGHKDITTTLNIYTDVTKELKKTEFEGLDKYFDNSIA